MRAGIVTHRLMLNFGGIVQNWALQKVLSGLGIYSATIDNYSHYPKWRWCLRKFVNTLKHKPLNIPFPRHSRIGQPSINDFIASQINILKTTKDEMPGLLHKNSLDCLIVGSDQVWRPRGLEESELDDMFLMFAKGWEGKRFAYAASFGSEEWEMNSMQTKKYKEAVKAFDYVSVREKSGVSLAKKYFDIKAECVLDPTLLLKAEDYLSLIDREQKPSKPFLMAYILDITDEKLNFVKKTSEKLGLEIKLMSGHQNLRGNERVEEWLAGFAYCNFVITDSFHGTVFSTIFHKPFATIINNVRGTARYQIFHEIGLGHRIKETFDNDISLIEDWDTMETHLSKKREESMSFLSKALS